MKDGAETKLDEYLRRLRECRRSRNEVIGLLSEQPLRLLQELETKEQVLLEARARLNKIQAGLKQRIKLKYTPGRTDASRWYVDVPGSPPQWLKNKPQHRRILKLADDQVLAESISNEVTTIQEQERGRLIIADKLGRVLSLWELTETRPRVENLPVWVPDKSVEAFGRRRREVLLVTQLIKDSGTAVDEYDARLDELIANFNSQGRRFQNVLTASWRIATKCTNTVTATTGPYFYRKRGGLHSRLMVRVGKVTREVIRQSGQRKFEDNLLAIYEEMNEVMKERHEVLSRLVSSYRLLQK